MTRNEMMNEIAQNRGLEDMYTIWFFNVCESDLIGDKELKMLYIAIMTLPLEED